MRNKKKVNIFLIIILNIFILTSCATNENKSSNNDTILVNLGSAVSIIDPGTSISEQELTLIANLFEGLMTYDENDKLTLGVAEKVDVSEDNLVYTFTLRDDAKWSNGEKVIAEDFRYSWIRSLKLNSPIKENLYFIKNTKKFVEGKVSEDDIGIKSIADNILEVRLEIPYESFLEILATSLYSPLHKESIENSEKWVYDSNTYMSNGPFKLKDMNLEYEIILEKNDNYWDKKSVKTNEINFSLLNDEDVAYSNLRNGKFHFLNSVSTVKNNDKVLFKDYDILRTYCIEINTKDPDISSETKEFLNNKKVREALLISLDREFISKNIGRPAYSYVPHNVDEINGQDFNNKKYFEDGSNSIDKANNLLKEAGYGKGDKQIPEIQLLYYGNLMDDYIFNIIKEQWSKIGVDIVLVKKDKDIFLEKKSKRNFEIAKFNWIPDFYGTIAFLIPFLSSSSYNTGTFSSEEYDNLIINGIFEENKDKEQKLFKEAEDILMEEKFLIPIVFPNSKKGISENLKGVFVSSLSTVRFKYAYLDK